MTFGICFRTRNVWLAPCIFWLAGVAALRSNCFANPDDKAPPSASSAASAEGPSKNALVLVVMDPMAAPLACDCVQGYAQRKYEELGKYLEAKLDRPVFVAWSESLVVALKDKTDDRVDIVIGKDSVVRSDALRAKLKVLPVASLTDMKGSTLQKGLFVVHASSPAASLLDLEDYQFLFGPDDCDEKWSAPRATLNELEIPFAASSKSSSSCSVAAKELMTLPTDAKTVAVISSYAEPLLEGCGAIKKGDLRVVGESGPVPFVSAFVNAKLSADQRSTIAEALLSMQSKEMLTALETKDGFTPYEHSAANLK